MANAINQWVPAPMPSAGVAPEATGDKNGIILPSAARTANTYTTDEIFNATGKGIRITADITNHNGGTVTITLQAKDPVTGKWTTIATSAGWSGSNQTRVLCVYPGITASAGGVSADTTASTIASTAMRLSIVVAAATVTFSVGAEYLI